MAALALVKCDVNVDNEVYRLTATCFITRTRMTPFTHDLRRVCSQVGTVGAFTQVFPLVDIEIEGNSNDPCTWRTHG